MKDDTGVLNKDNLKKKSFHALFWDILGKLAMSGSSFIVTIFLTRLLEPTDFGLIAIVMVIIGIASVFIDTGLGGALIQRRRVLPIHYSSVFYFNLFIGVLLSILTYFSAPFIADFYENQELIPFIEVMSLLFILNSLTLVQSIMLRRELNNKLLSKVGLIASVVSGTIGVTFAFFDAGVWSLVLQIFAHGIIYNALLWNSSRWIPKGFSFKALRQLWGFGFRMFFVALLSTLFDRLDFIVIGKLFTLQILGYFERAKSLNFIVVKYTSQSLTSVLFPALSKIQNDLPRLREVIIKILGILTFMIFLFLGELFLVSEEIVIFLFSAKWIATIIYFKLLILSSFVHPIGALFINILSSRGNSKKVLRLVLYRTLFLLVNFYIGFMYGIEEYLYGLILVSILTLIMQILYVKKELTISFLELSKPILLQATIAVVSVLIVLLIQRNLLLTGVSAFLIKSIIFLGSYVLFNYLLKTKSLEYIMIQLDPLIKKIGN